MAQGFIPGVHRHWERSARVGEGSLLPSRGAITPGPLGVREAPTDSDELCERIVRASTWFDTHEYARAVFCMHSFALGVVYGVGESLVTSVVEAFELAKTLVLADLYDARKGRLPLPMRIARDGVLWPTREIASRVAAWYFESELRQAHQTRDELIQALWQIIAHPIDALAAIKDEYVSKWNAYRNYQQQDSLISQFRAGRIFGGLLLDLISLIAGAAGFVKTLVTAFPKLIKSVQSLQRVAQGAVRHKLIKATRTNADSTGDLKTTSPPAIAGVVRSDVDQTPQLLPPQPTKARLEYGVTLPNKRVPKAPGSKSGTDGRNHHQQAPNRAEKSGMKKLLATKPMRAKYVGEEIAGNPISWLPPGTGPVIYLDDKLREFSRLTTKDGKLYDSQGKLYDTRGAATFDLLERAIFVMDERGRIYASMNQKTYFFHHSSLSQGKPMAMAGEMEVHDGVLQYISNQSGHYWHSNEYLDQAVEHMKSEGIDFEFVHVDPVR